MQDILNKLNPIFARVFEDETLQITEESSARDIDKWDSLRHVLLISEIEKAFNIHFELEEMIGFQNVGDIARSLEKKV
ncbi:MAG: acyl carrier protein [Phaeodactylibacter sp.]|nr:acyl carrier protein [Phaeodactylibacter sp.]MCB9288870.1 acyl carrier protein [Lewinellaceae bacterium]